MNYEVGDILKNVFDQHFIITGKFIGERERINYKVEYLEHLEWDLSDLFLHQFLDEHCCLVQKGKR